GGDRGQAFQQNRQAILQAEVFAIPRGVLTDQVDFLHALVEHGARFRHHRLKSATAEMPSNLWDNAKTARMIATLGDLDIGTVARRCENPWGHLVIEIPAFVTIAGSVYCLTLGDSHNSLQLIGSDDCVHFGDLLLDLVA